MVIVGFFLSSFCCSLFVLLLFCRCFSPFLLFFLQFFCFFGSEGRGATTFIPALKAISVEASWKGIKMGKVGSRNCRSSQTEGVVRASTLLKYQRLLSLSGKGYCINSVGSLGSIISGLIRNGIDSFSSGKVFSVNGAVTGMLIRSN